MSLGLTEEAQGDVSVSEGWKSRQVESIGGRMRNSFTSSGESPRHSHSNEAAGTASTGGGVEGNQSTDNGIRLMFGYNEMACLG